LFFGGGGGGGGGWDLRFTIYDLRFERSKKWARKKEIGKKRREKKKRSREEREQCLTRWVDW